MTAMNIAIAGASGRMGRILIEAVENAPDARLAGALDRAGSAGVGGDAAAFLGKPGGVLVRSDLAQGLAGAQYLIDFTRPEGTLHHLALCEKHGVKAVIGTTGFEPKQLEALKKAAEKVAMVWSPNMAVGVNATFKLLEVAAKILAQGYDIEVIEAHHSKKVDAPSGTALRMGEVIAQGLGVDLQDVGVFAREGITGERKAGTIGFSTIRGGDIVGDHTVLFAGIGERIEITHKSSSRMTYAQGSIRAAQFLAGHDHRIDLQMFRVFDRALFQLHVFQMQFAIKLRCNRQHRFRELITRSHVGTGVVIDAPRIGATAQLQQDRDDHARNVVGAGRTAIQRRIKYQRLALLGEPDDLRLLLRIASLLEERYIADLGQRKPDPAVAEGVERAQARYDKAKAAAGSPPVSRVS